MSVNPRESDDRSGPKPASSKDGGPAGGQDLAKRLLKGGGKRLQFLDRHQLKEVIAASIHRSLQVQFGGLEPEILSSVTQEATARIFRGMNSLSREVRGFSSRQFGDALSQVRKSLVAERERVRSQLGALEQQLDQQRDGLEEERRAAEEAELAAARIPTSQQHELEQMVRDLFERHGGSASGLDDLQAEVASLALEAVRAERRKAASQQVASKDQEVQMLERRVAKLMQSLEMTETQLKQLKNVKAVDPGLASIFRTVQGLSEDEANADVKREMMAAIFKANLDLKERLANKQTESQE